MTMFFNAGPNHVNVKFQTYILRDGIVANFFLSYSMITDVCAT